MSGLKDNVQFLRGVGPKRAESLNKIGLKTVGDLFEYYPKNYSDYTKKNFVSAAVIDQVISTEVQVVSEAFLQKTGSRTSLLKQRVRDEGGEFFLVWFNKPYLKYKYKSGARLIVNGRVKLIGKEYQIVNPICEEEDSVKKSGSVYPIYPQTKGLRSDVIAAIISTAFKEYQHHIGETIPDYIRTKYSLETKVQSVREIHFPSNANSLQSAIKRLKFEELLTVQLTLMSIKNRNVHLNKGIVHASDDVVRLFSYLPYSLTGAQSKVLKEIFDDMTSSKKMIRLLQGDVGSGKTIVAFLSMLKAFFSGYQSVLLAPTEILAKQHLQGLETLLHHLNLADSVSCCLLTGSLRAEKKNEIKKEIQSGAIRMIIGTHALLQEDVHFENLGLIVTDEQHRFGVRQRRVLENKRAEADVLVMSATPIPRTLSLILHGDLDVSIIDEMPPGRQPVKTYTINNSMLVRMYGFIREQIEQGRQAYIVCPLIEESEMSATSVEELFDRLQEGELKNYRLGLLHGKVPAEEKDRIIRSFLLNETQVLIATTVIEVGVNIPNATIMVIYDADRFGLSQLHQLRGRVGRGDARSYCILVNNNSSELSWKRMKVLEQSNDGFYISEKDLELRGPGDYFGTKQHGIPSFKLVNLFEDLDLMKEVQSLAIDILKEDPLLEKSYNLFFKNAVDRLLSEIVADVALN